MTIKYGKFEMPKEITLEKETATNTFARFIAEPFEKGYGHTIGISLRRMLLTSLEAPAIIGIRIEGVPHENTAIEGVVEDMTNIILNLKGALLRKLPIEAEEDFHGTRILTTLLNVTKEQLDKNNGEVKVKFGEIIKDEHLEVINPDQHLLTVSSPIKRQIDLRVAFGRGYVPTERLIVRDKAADEILIDASFSPVRLVNYHVENTRVGQQTDFDRLIIEITTDGRIIPTEALSFAAQIGVKHFDVFKDIEAEKIVFDEVEEEGPTDKDEMMEKLCLRIDEIELSVRSTNCLSGANIETIAELVSIPERKMLEFRNFGKKSLNEIKQKLTDMGLHLGMDLAKYGITLDNVKEKMRRYHEEKASREAIRFEELPNHLG